MQRPTLPDWLARIYALLFALLPWSVDVSFGAWNLRVPAEPLIAVAGIGLLITCVRQRIWPVKGLAWLPVLWVAWAAVAAACSTMPLVSWKYWLVDTGQCWVFFAGLLLWPELWLRLARLFAYSLAGVALYTMIHHGLFHFRPDQAMLAPIPFFADHTVYSAVLALALLGFNTRSWAGRPVNDTWALGIPGWIPGVFALGLFLSFSRAAWLSLLLAGFAGSLIVYRKRWSWLAFAALLLLVAGFFFRDKISARLAADVSSMERLNRYSCAVRMAEDRPWTGFGPGTFMFQFLPYQRPAEMTRISITTPIARRGPENFGRGGGAHSEYLRALAELGWPGLILWLLVVGCSLLAGTVRYIQTGQFIYLALTLGLLSFFAHGLVNDFLHDARVAALVWGAVGEIFSGSSDR